MHGEIQHMSPERSILFIYYITPSQAILLKGKVYHFYAIISVHSEEHFCVSARGGELELTDHFDWSKQKTHRCLGDVLSWWRSNQMFQTSLQGHDRNDWCYVCMDGLHQSANLTDALCLRGLNPHLLL